MSALDINTSGSASAQGELAAPHLLMRFPPIAYLLNSLLTNLNYIRECPLVTTELPALAAVFAVFQNICAYLVQKSSEVRHAGEKYLGASKLDKKKTKTSGDTTNAGAAEKKEPMDHLYAQAIALELLPHVLLCIDTIFGAQSARLDAKMKALKAKELRRSSAATVSGSSAPATSAAAGLKLTCLVSSLYDARDLVDGEVLDQVQRCWEVLVQGGLLQAEVLSRQPAQQHSAMQGAGLAPPVVVKAAVPPAVQSTEFSADTESSEAVEDSEES